MSIEDEEALRRVMKHFRLGPDALLGFGSEAWVLALGPREVARVHRDGTSAEDLASRAALLEELQRSASALPFQIPRVGSSLEVAGRQVTIEPRLPGRPLSRVLNDTVGPPRERLLTSYLRCSRQLQLLRVERPWYGDLSESAPVRASSFRGYLELRARRSLEEAGADFARVDARALAMALPEPAQAGFVHLDLCPANVLVEDEIVTAVVDFGGVPIIGDARLEPLSAAAYLAPAITRGTTEQDRWLARDWLTDQGLGPWFEAARRWLAARWSFAKDDRPLQGWCRHVLGAAQRGGEDVDRGG